MALSWSVRCLFEALTISSRLPTSVVPKMQLLISGRDRIYAIAACARVSPGTRPSTLRIPAADLANRRLSGRNRVLLRYQTSAGRLKRRILAAKATGLRVTGIQPDGTLLVDDGPRPLAGNESLAHDAGNAPDDPWAHPEA